MNPEEGRWVFDGSFTRREVIVEWPNGEDLVHVYALIKLLQV